MLFNLSVKWRIFFSKTSFYELTKVSWKLIPVVTRYKYYCLPNMKHY
jgi:hypothetical protein